MGSGKLMQKTCLKQHYSLRRQLLASFGSATFITLMLVVIVSIIMLNAAGNLVKERSSNVMREQINSRIVETTKTTAESFAKFKENYDGVVQQVVEITLDRIVGYPESGWEDDRFVPFYDVDSQRNVYPLEVDPIPLDWQITRDVTDENFERVFPGRKKTFWLDQARNFVSYSSGSFFMQGQCNPEITEPIHVTYYPNCTEANNDVKTGGSVRPTSTAEGLYNKSAELAILLRPLHEVNGDVFFVGVYFFNSGAGASVTYPGVYYSGVNVSYISAGCDWLRDVNTKTGAKLATEEEIARCRPKGEMVRGREYNPVEREWFREAVVNRDSIYWYGPHKLIGVDIALMTVCKAVFDRRTGALIGVAYLDIAMPDLDENLIDSRLYEKNSEWSVLDLEDGRVLTDSLHSTSGAGLAYGSNINVFWWDLGILTKSTFTDIRDNYWALFKGTKWTNETLAAAAAMSVRDCPYGVAAVYPLPVPPREYNPDYEPYAVAVQVVTRDAYAPIKEFESSINNDVLKGSFVAAGIGLFGMFVILLMLWCVARALTQPLLWMELVSWRIVNHSDKRSGNALHLENDDPKTAMVRCSPRTEITELVEEFRLMITGFSGGGASTVAESEPNEIRNSLTWQSDFKHLYTTASARKSIRSSITASTPSTEPENCSSRSLENHQLGTENIGRTHDEPVPTMDGSKASKSISNTVFPAPPKKHAGPVAASPEVPIGFEGGKGVYRSPLFCWIVLLIVLPLLITNTLITVIVTQTMIDTVPAWVDDLSDYSVTLEVSALEAIVKSKATLLSMILRQPVRELYWIARIAGWLYFDAVPRSDSFTELSEATEECKSYSPFTCEILKTDLFTCPCSWNDNSAVRTCTPGLNESESRRLEKRFYAVLAQDFDPGTGNRSKASSFPEAATSPETTSWQTNISELPGAQKGANASGFETTYDRLRVSSALAVVQFPLYNYREAAGYHRYVIGSYLSLEADGMFTGYSGCSFIHSTFARFVSSEDTKAYEVSEDLCPKGKYGFDPRCRPWYNTTRKNYEQLGQPIHMTAPYVFGGDISVGLSAATPIANPATGDFVGEMLLDYPYSILQEAFDTLEFPLSFLITPDADIYGGDIVVGSNKSQWSPSLMIDELFQDDGNNHVERLEFEEDILTKMKLGQSGSGRFSRRQQDGKVEKFVVAYAPVNQTILLPLDPGRLDAGAYAVTMTIYSVAVVMSDKGVRESFTEAEGEMYGDLNRLAMIDAALILFLSIVFLVIVCKVTIHVTRPMIVLLETVRNINSNEGRRDIPPLRGGSREVHQVYNSFSKLYKIVRIANAAFFSGNLFWANQIINDAIQLFRKINDRKAIGIACNNLGNITLARILELGNQSGSSPDRGFVECAALHFDEAVEISQSEFEKADSFAVKAAYARELADRLFNRGLFLLFIDGESKAPENARTRGLADIAKARDLDYDVKEYYIENKLLLHFSDECFSRMLRRIHGLCAHYADEEVVRIWDPTTLVDEADELLFAAWHEREAPLFCEISRVGRLQQLEAAAIRLEGCKGNHTEAARIGMRMFTEDEYLLEAPFSLAASALLKFAQSDDGCWSSKTLTSVHSALRKMSRTCRSPTLVLRKCVVFALELNERLESDDLFPLINSKCMDLFENHCCDEDFIGVVAYTVKGDQTLELSSKAHNKEQQSAVLDLATRSTSERVCSALPFAMQVVLDSSVSQEMDSYILLFTDGYSWDSGPYTSIKWQIARMNRENESNVHLIILGVDVEPEHVEECKAMCSVSKGSFFVELTAENVDATFASISRIFSTGQLCQQFMNATTMQKF
ncbi:hypothetical protein ACA910_016997 [Epithemia clementina (nom. ined.)]